MMFSFRRNSLSDFTPVLEVWWINRALEYGAKVSVNFPEFSPRAIPREASPWGGAGIYPRMRPEKDNPRSRHQDLEV
jgi:hypothetical protein